MPQSFSRRWTIFRDDDDLDRQIELAGKLEVALVVRRHGHHRAGAVVAENEVRDPDGHRLFRERVDGAEAGIEPLLLDLAAYPRGAVLCSERLRLLAERRWIACLLSELRDERMLGPEQHECRAVNRIDARREHLNGGRGIAFHRELHPR